MASLHERRISLTSSASPPIQQFATFKSVDGKPHQHIPTPALEPIDQLTSLSGPSTRGGPPATNTNSNRSGAKRDRSVDIYEKHTLTKPRVDEKGEPFSFKTGAAAEFEKPVLEEKTIKIMQLPPLGRRKSGSGQGGRSMSLMSPRDVVRMEEKMNEAMEMKERSRERGEAARMLMGNVQSSSKAIEERGSGILGLAQRARDRSRSSSRNRWEQKVGGGLAEGRQKRRSLTVMTDAVVESEDEEELNPRTGRLGARF